MVYDADSKLKQKQKQDILGLLGEANLAIGVEISNLNISERSGR